MNILLLLFSPFLLLFSLSLSHLMRFYPYPIYNGTNTSFFLFFSFCMSSQKSHLRIYTLLRMCFRVSMLICPGPCMILPSSIFFSFLPMLLFCLPPPSLRPSLFCYRPSSIVFLDPTFSSFIFHSPQLLYPTPHTKKKIKTSSPRQVGERLLQRNRVRRGYRIR